MNKKFITLGMLLSISFAIINAKIQILDEEVYAKQQAVEEEQIAKSISTQQGFIQTFRDSKVKTIISLLKEATTLQDKSFALSRADELYHKEIDELVVSYLDDPTDSQKFSDYSIEKPKYQALETLITKYKETQLDKDFISLTSEEIDELRNYIYKIMPPNKYSQEEAGKVYEAKIYEKIEQNFQQAATQFKTWWTENKDKIEYYGDNQYRIVGQETQPTQKEVKEVEEPTINPNLLADDTSQNAQPANQAKQETTPQQITTEPTQDKPTNWIIYVLAAVVLLVILIVLKLKKNK